MYYVSKERRRQRFKTHPWSKRDKEINNNWHKTQHGTFNRLRICLIAVYLMAVKRTGNETFPPGPIRLTGAPERLTLHWQLRHFFSLRKSSLQPKTISNTCKDCYCFCHKVAVGCSYFDLLHCRPGPEPTSGRSTQNIQYACRWETLTSIICITNGPLVKEAAGGVGGHERSTLQHWVDTGGGGRGNWPGGETMNQTGGNQTQQEMMLCISNCLHESAECFYRI